jgi:hypothetical protein
VYANLGQSIAGDLSPDEMIFLTKATQDLSQAFGVDMDEALRTVSILMKTGVAKDSRDALNILTAGFQNGLNVSDDLLDTLNEYSDDFADLGLTGGEVLGLLNTGLEAGALNTDKLGDALNEFGVNLRDPAIGDSLRDIDMELFGIFDQFQKGEQTERQALDGMLRRLNAIEDPIKRDQAGVMLFRSMWEDLGETSILALSDMEAGVLDTTDAVEDLQAQNQTFSTQWQLALRQIQVALIPIGERIIALANVALPLVIQAIEFLVPAFDALLGLFEGTTSFDEFWSTFSEGINNIIPIVLDTLNTLLEAVLAWIVENGPAILKTLAEWELAFLEWAINMTGVLLAELADLIDQVIDWIIDNRQLILSTLRQWAAAFLEWIVPIAFELLARLSDLVLRIRDWIIENGPAILEQLGEWARAFIDWILPIAGDLLLKLPGITAAILKWILQVTPDILAELLKWTAAFVEWVGPVVKDLLIELGKLLMALSRWFVNNMLPAIAAEIPGVVAAFLAFVDEMKVKVVPALKGFLTSVINTIQFDIIPGLALAAVDTANAFLNSFLAIMRMLGPRLIDVLNTAIPDFINLGQINLGFPLGSVDLGSVDLPNNPIPGGTRAMGGRMLGGLPTLVGEQGPEIVTAATDDGFVIPAGLSNALMGGGTNNNMTLIINTNAPAENAVNDFEQMKAMAVQ